MKPFYSVTGGLLSLLIMLSISCWQMPIQAQIVNESFESSWTSEGTYGPHVIPPNNFTSYNTYPRDGKAYNGNRSVEFNGQIGAYLQTPEMSGGIGEVSFYYESTVPYTSRQGYLECQISDDGETYTTIHTLGWVTNNYSYKNATITVNSPTAKYFRILQTNVSSTYARTQIDYMSVSGFGDPEPSSHVTDLNCTKTTAHSFTVAWTDESTVAPAKGYVIKTSAMGVQAISVPIDTIPSSDSTFVRVVLAPTKTCSFVDLPPETTFDVQVFPFSNTESAIDYLTSGDVATLSVTTNELPDTIMNEGFESETLNGWTQKSLVGSWTWRPYFYQERNLVFLYGFQDVNEDWLISPPLYLNYYKHEFINFNNSRNGTEPTLKLMYSTNYDGTGNPNDFEWAELPATWSPQGFYSWRNSGDVDLSAIFGFKTYLAILYKNSVNTETSVWLIDDILIKGTPLSLPTLSLAKVEIEGFNIDDFDPDITEYWIKIPDTKSAKLESNIICEAACLLTNVTVQNATDLYGTLEERTATVTLTGPKGETRIYSFIFYTETQLDDVETASGPVFGSNPFRSALRIENWENFTQVQLYDLSGKSIADFTINQAVLQETTNLPAGIYILNMVRHDGKRFVEKVIKQ